MTFRSSHLLNGLSATLRNRSNAGHRKDDIGFRLVVDNAEVLTGRR